MKDKNICYKFLNFFERSLANFQGKGWGAGTTKKEFAAAITLLSNKEPKLCIDIVGNEGLIQITKYKKSDEFFVTTNYIAKRKA